MNLNHIQRPQGQDAVDQSQEFLDATYLNPPQQSKNAME